MTFHSRSIEKIVDWVFSFISNDIPSVGVIGAVACVSLTINFLALPLYNVADRLQEKERNLSKSLDYRTSRIKKAFTGDERFMMLSEYYRQNNYHPLYTLRSSLSILIEIPFFIAAYHYLSSNEALKGASWWIFNDLGSPDNFSDILGFPLHILPIIMTLINLISGIIYTKEASLREKIQLYGIALLFLVLLYNSPSGLVIYWILNNVFSLIKNIVMKLKSPVRVLHIAVSFILLILSAVLFRREGAFFKKIVVLSFSAFVTLFPFLIKTVSKKIKFQLHASVDSGDLKILILSGLALSLFCGLILPASVISTSPIEFSFLGKTDSPLSYVWSSFWIFLGFFLFWPIAIYKMFESRVKNYLTFILFVVFICALGNSFIFKSNYGDINTDFSLVINSFEVSVIHSIFSILLALFSFVIIYLKKNVVIRKCLIYFLIVLCFSEIGVSSLKISNISQSFRAYKENMSKNNDEKKDTEIAPFYSLSKNKKNVVVFFLDRAIGIFPKSIFTEFPEMKEQFQGFSYYPNTVSFSNFTVEGTPPMLGGYEYTQENINARSFEYLREKHNEASLVMPKLFCDAGFEATVTDPPWGNYRWAGDLSAFEKISGIKSKELSGKYYSCFLKEKRIVEFKESDEICRKEIINFIFIESIFPFLRKTFNEHFRSSVHVKGIPSTANSFFSQLSNLYFLPELTDFISEKDTFTFIGNDATHEVAWKLNDDYETPASENSSDSAFLHYQANVAAFKQIGKWLNFLRENNCYDNTRVIIVSDHGRNIDVPPYDMNIISYNALLMVKDFNSNDGFKIDESFMTNADTLFLAKKDLSLSDENPFTHKKLVPQKENGVNVYDCAEINAEKIRDEKKFKLDESKAWHVSENIFDNKNWIPLNKWNSDFN